MELVDRFGVRIVWVGMDGRCGEGRRREWVERRSVECVLRVKDVLRLEKRVK